MIQKIDIIKTTMLPQTDCSPEVHKPARPCGTQSAPFGKAKRSVWARTSWDDYRLSLAASKRS